MEGFNHKSDLNEKEGTPQASEDGFFKSSHHNDEWWTGAPIRISLSKAESLREHAATSRRSSPGTLHEDDHASRPSQLQRCQQTPSALTALPTKQSISRQSSLRHQISSPEVNTDALPPFDSSAGHHASISRPSPCITRSKSQPSSTSRLPQYNSYDNNDLPIVTISSAADSEMPWPVAKTRSTPQTPKMTHTSLSRAPSLTFKRLSSLDQLISYREDRESWKRESYASSQQMLPPAIDDEPVPPVPKMAGEKQDVLVHVAKCPVPVERELHDTSEAPNPQRKFRHFIAEIGFCFTVAMTQLLAEYMISGFAIVLPNLWDENSSAGAGITGMFWPAALLTLILSAFLLIFARISDMYGGYGPFMFGLIWLTIWSLIPGFVSSNLMLNISRAMQGLAIAAYTPSTFALIGSIYPEGPRRSIVLGLYGACAPLGLYTGFLVGGALPIAESKWYFWIAAVLAFITTIAAYLSVPHDRTDRKTLNLQMDWLGAFLITGGLILVTYALSVQPYANANNPEKNGFEFSIVYAPLTAGLVCLIIAVWVEGWYASCPMLPFEFFKPKGVIALCVACLFFYGSFGVWLYNGAEYFVSPSATTDPDSVKGIMLSLYYTPMAVGGMIFCVVGSSLLHIVPTKLLLIFSGMAWIAAPLIFAVGPVPLNYWAEVLPSMICGTLGIDLTFTIASIFLSSSQPLKFQGVAGAVSSILVNLAMSFSLPISLIAKEAATVHVSNDLIDDDGDAVTWGFRAAFIYGAVSAACGLIIVVFFVQISRSVFMGERQADDEAGPRTSPPLTSTTTVVVDDERRS